MLDLPARVTKLVEAEPDRGVILILGAYLDEILGVLITGACVSDTLAAGILKHGQPAGTFNNRMALAQALGLIHEEDVQALRIVQKIRNKAAHFDLSGRGFEVLFDSSITVQVQLCYASANQYNAEGYSIPDDFCYIYNGNLRSLSSTVGKCYYKPFVQLAFCSVFKPKASAPSRGFLFSVAF